MLLLYLYYIRRQEFSSFLKIKGTCSKFKFMVIRFGILTTKIRTRLPRGGLPSLDFFASEKKNANGDKTIFFTKLGITFKMNYNLRNIGDVMRQVK